MVRVGGVGASVWRAALRRDQLLGRATDAVRARHPGERRAARGAIRIDLALLDVEVDEEPTRAGA